jgi:23S rRNA (guanosine2251-2'-O)-methyltransferase
VGEAVEAGLVEEVVLLPQARTTEGLRDLIQAVERSGVRTRPADRVMLDGLAPDHQGVAARVRLPAVLGEADLSRLEIGASSLVVVLDGITDPQNLGASARVADAAGAIALVTRERRAAGITAAAVRASAGALLHLPTAVVANIPRALERLKDRGFTVVGLDETADRTIYDLPRPDGPVAVVLGSEGEGLSRLVREACDDLVRLPMRGKVASLNASTALAAALFAAVVPATDPGDHGGPG